MAEQNCYLWVSHHKSTHADNGMYGHLLHVNKIRIKANYQRVCFVVTIALIKKITSGNRAGFLAAKTLTGNQEHILLK